MPDDVAAALPVRKIAAVPPGRLTIPIARKV